VIEAKETEGTATESRDEKQSSNNSERNERGALHEAKPGRRIMDRSAICGSAAVLETQNPAGTTGKSRS